VDDNFYNSRFGVSRGKKKSFFSSTLFHILLFVITFITTLIAGMQWITASGGPYEISSFTTALPYTFSILFILSCHEFGHYFAAKYHGVDVTFPYFIPFPPIPLFINFGTMGAVIKTKTPIRTNKAMFDIGVAGPIAGFIASLIILIYGFTHLPPVDYLLNIHPDYFSPEYGKNALSLTFGDTLLFSFLRDLFADPNAFIPPMSEVYHYPYLCVGWFGLFVTAMNMIPVGQLDGGHVVFSLFGHKIHEHVAGISMLILGLFGFMGIFDSLLELNLGFGWSGWLFWGLVLYFVIKLKHPPVEHFEKLGLGRRLLGYFSLLILLLSFSPAPLVLSL